VPRRVSLPHADDLFRRTGDTPVVRAVPDEVEEDRARSRKPSGRVRHDEKMTVYVTSAELLELEQTRLALRAEHGLAVDRGRLVREALALVLADFDAHGDDSALVRRLTEE
jgi:L-aminopeptidase/D-esterase-like protein